MQHKGYNTDLTGNVNSVAGKFGYNGIELEESLGMNLHEMDFRQYDPSIARFTGIDPVVHHSMGTYTAFDNNPVYWADPSGADAVKYINDGSQRFIDLFNSLKQESKTWKKDDDPDSSEQDSNSQDEEQSDPDPLTKIQVLDQRGWFGSLLQNRRWSPENSFFDYEVNDDGFLTGETSRRILGGTGSIEFISSGGLSILRLPKYLKYLKGVKSTKDALRFAVKSSDAFKLISGGNRFKAVLEGGSLGAGQFFSQLVKNGWIFEKSGKNVKLLKDGETIIFRGSTAKKGFDTFTLPKAYEGKNVDIFFK